MNSTKWQWFLMVAVAVATGYMMVLASEPLPELPKENLLEHRIIKGNYEY